MSRGQELRLASVCINDEMTIASQSKAAATCIARELSAFGSTVQQTSEGWEVSLSADDEEVAILSALERCLGANGIGAVAVSIRGQKYVMEAAPA